MWFEAKEILDKEINFLKMSVSYFSVIGSRKFLPFITTVFAGNISKAHLEGVGLANTLISVLVLALSQGYVRVIQTFGAQVYESSEPGKLTSCLIKCLLQGGMLQLILLGPFLNLVYLIDMLPNSGVYPTPKSAGNVEDKDFRDIAVNYLRLTVPVEFLDYAWAAISTYFIIQGQTKSVHFASAIMVAAHTAANYILVSLLGLGVEGLALAAITGRSLTLTVLLGICVENIKRGSFSWNVLSIEVLLGWEPMVKIGIFSAVFVFVKVIVIEISLFSSQFVSMNTLSAVVILVQIHNVYKTTSGASAHASANLIGKSLAEGNISNVKQYMMLTMTNVFLEVVIGSSICYFLRDSLARMFTDDPEVIDLFCKVFWLVCLFFTCSHFQMNVNEGILTAFGEQSFTALNVIWSCLLVGVPIVILTIFFTDLGLIGILIGWTTTKLLLLITGFMKLWWTKIGSEIEKSRKRVEKFTYGSLETGQTNEIFKDSANEPERTEEVARSEGGFNSAYPEYSSVTREGLNTEDIPQRSADVDGIYREVKFVLIWFLFTTVLFVTLAGISFLRDFD
ncbi:hypothetical protein ACHWQZ_G016173 [Mnemiopsis leidyi]